MWFTSFLLEKICINIISFKEITPISSQYMYKILYLSNCKKKKEIGTPSIETHIKTNLNMECDSNNSEKQNK